MAESLPHRMAVVLVRLECLSHGAVQMWNKSGSPSGEHDDKMIALILRHEDPPHLLFRRLYEQQLDDEGRLRIVLEAEEELKSWTRRTAKLGASKPLTEVILEDGKGYDPEVVAQRFGVAPAFVRRLRAKDGLGTEDGKLVVDDALSQSDAAAALSRRGLSQVEIAKRMGVSQPTVHRLLKARRFRRTAA